MTTESEKSESMNRFEKERAYNQSIWKETKSAFETLKEIDASDNGKVQAQSAKLQALTTLLHARSFSHYMERFSFGGEFKVKITK